MRGTTRGAAALLAAVLTVGAAPLAAQDEAGEVPLDGGPVCVVVRCSDELWAAYDQIDGRLLRTWHGELLPDGDGYRSRGHVYTGEEPPPRWELVQGDRVIAGSRQLTAWDTDEGWLRLHAVLTFDDGREIGITEVVDAWREGRRREGRPIVLFDRSFHVAEGALPEDAALRVWLEVTPVDVVWQGDPWPSEAAFPSSGGEGRVTRAPFVLEPGQRNTWTRIWDRPRDGWIPDDELPETANRLTDAEREAGWEWLFDGSDTSAWRGAGRQELPAGWVVEDGCLKRDGPGGDIVTRETFGDFELSLQWKISPGGNSGIFFHVDDSRGPVYVTGPEMQVLDNARHPDGRRPETSAAANYGLHPAAFDLTMPVGLFNRAFLRVRDGVVEHWINGYGVVRYELGSESWEELVAASKFAAWEHYGRLGRGSIALQDHGDEVWYRAIKIRRLDD